MKPAMSVTMMWTVAIDEQVIHDMMIRLEHLALRHPDEVMKKEEWINKNLSKDPDCFSTLVLDIKGSSDHGFYEIELVSNREEAILDTKIFNYCILSHILEKKLPYTLFDKKRFIRRDNKVTMIIDSVTTKIGARQTAILAGVPFGKNISGWASVGYNVCTEVVINE